jgi:hypothetical protein
MTFKKKLVKQIALKFEMKLSITNGSVENQFTLGTPTHNY